MRKVLGIGVIGVRRLSRYRLALEKVQRFLTVRAVYDQVSVRARRVGQRLPCGVAAGVVELLERDDVQAVLLVDRQWFGFWPVLQACRLGKPVCCPLPLSADGEHAEKVGEHVRQANLPMLVPAAPHLQQAIQGLQSLTDCIGQPRLIRAEVGVRQAGATRSAVFRLLEAMIALTSKAPIAVTASVAGSLTSAVLEFPTGLACQLSVWLSPLQRTSCRLGVVADQGTAEYVSPRRLSWRDASGEHHRQLTGPRPEQAILKGLVHMLRSGPTARRDLEDALGVLSWCRALQTSAQEGRRVPIPPRSANG